MAPDSTHSDNPEQSDPLVESLSGGPARQAPSTGAFTSRAERRLWLSALAVIAAIYASLGRAPELSDSLQESGLLSVAFLGAFVAAICAVAILALSRRQRLRELAVTLGVAAVYTVALVRLQIPAERTHLFEYGVVATLLYLALLERRVNGGRVRAPTVWAIAGTAALGWIDEAIQAVLPNRVYDLRDVGLNALAGLLAVTAIASMRWARGPGRTAADQPSSDPTQSED